MVLEAPIDDRSIKPFFLLSYLSQFTCTSTNPEELTNLTAHLLGTQLKPEQNFEWTDPKRVGITLFIGCTLISEEPTVGHPHGIVWGQNGKGATDQINWNHSKKCWNWNSILEQRGRWSMNICWVHAFVETCSYSLGNQSFHNYGLTQRTSENLTSWSNRTTLAYRALKLVLSIEWVDWVGASMTTNKWYMPSNA